MQARRLYLQEMFDNKRGPRTLHQMQGPRMHDLWPSEVSDKRRRNQMKDDIEWRHANMLL
ncbi:hypothetical protein QTG54_013624 [Skeletonema marinoi]|uniref:Uncharacterized protein n=1 Tax=Skeletonema marinoi TaxID=267567 RepID=A0AAD9D626_9STRA|nr:hypothetical protein QTG54_013624 [Skeletonema marinoi]